MTYQYRNIRAEFDAPCEDECIYTIYANRGESEMCLGRGTVSVCREVTDLSRCALEEFARKYIDVNYGHLCHYLTEEVPKTDLPLSLAAQDAASDIQCAANYIVDYCKDERGEPVECEFEEVVEGTGIEIACIEGYCGAIERAVREITDGDVTLTGCTFIVELPQEQNDLQTRQIQMM